ncbi:MAG TPA: hypothetical protein VF004_08445 [Burkholderiales bacterium]
MDGVAVFRLMALIPERTPRLQTGAQFRADGSPRIDLLCRFLHWLGPLNAVSREEQQVLGVRAASARPLGEGEEPIDAEGEDLLDEAEDQPGRPMEAGTQIAA